jgi:Ca2+-binding RTX toxin-like protein
VKKEDQTNENTSNNTNNNVNNNTNNNTSNANAVTPKISATLLAANKSGVNFQEDALSQTEVRQLLGKDTVELKMDTATDLVFKAGIVENQLLLESVPTANTLLLDVSEERGGRLIPKGLTINGVAVQSGVESIPIDVTGMQNNEVRLDIQWDEDQGNVKPEELNFELTVAYIGPDGAINNLKYIPFTGDADKAYTLLNFEPQQFIKTGSTDLVINANDFSNEITTGNGNDTIHGSDGNDTIDGGNGTDTVDYSQTTQGDINNDRVRLKVDDTSLSAIKASGTDELLNVETVVGSSGQTDTLDFSGAKSTVSANLADGKSTLKFNGQDTEFTFNGFENLIGSDNNDTLTGDANANLLEGGRGNDRLNGGGGADTLVGGLGDDVYEINGQGVTIVEEGEGTDLVESTIHYTLDNHLENLRLMGSADLNGTGNTLNNLLTGNAGKNILDGGDGHDTLIGGAGNDSLLGGDGDDTLDGGTGNDNLTGGAGNDTLLGGDGNDTLDGGGDNDSLDGGAGNDNLTGGGGNDTLLGGAGDDTLDGGGGNDRLDGGAGADTMRGGSGNDIYVVDNAFDIVEEKTEEGTDTVEASISFALTSTPDVENLTLTGAGNINGNGNTLNNVIIGNSGNNLLEGGDGADSLTGGAGNDTLLGADGEDTLDGGDGIDSLDGGNGNDLLFGGAGADTINGGDGDDTVSYSGSDAAVTVNLALGSGTGGHAQGDVLSNIENLVGSSAHSDTLTGNAGANRIEGGGGNDTLDGGGGNDTLLGGTGDDTYIINNTGVTITELANDGTDTVISSVNDYTLGAYLENLTLTATAIKGTGNDLNNVITGNGNNNHLIGGGGNDTLVINATGLSSGTFDGGSGNDSLKITASAGATIDLRGIDNTKFISIETLDLTAQNNNILKLDLNTIKSLVDPSSGTTPTLSVKLASGDKIEFEAASGQQVFDNTATKNMTIFGGSGTSLEQLAIINYA